VTRGVHNRAAVLLVLLLLGSRPAQATQGDMADTAGGATTSPALAEARAMMDSASQDPAARIAAVRVLAMIGSYPALQRATLMLQYDVDTRVRRAALEALAATGNHHLAPLIRAAAANDPDPDLRAAAARHAQRLAALAKRPGTAAGYSLLCPGCGYFYLGRPGRAAAYLGTTAALVAAAVAFASGDGLLDAGQGPNRTPTTVPLALPAAVAAMNLWSYGIFASYRDARLARNDLGSSYPVSPEGLPDLVTAPFRPRVLARPWFWVGLPLMVGSAFAFTALVAPEDFGENTRSLRDGGGVWFLGRHYGTRTGVLLGEAYYGSLFLPVGVGEEALFRGVVQPAMADWLGLWEGWAVTSLLFGAAHIGNFAGQSDGFATAVKAVPFITTVGSYMGFTAIRTGYRLETSVALHFWYDFLLGTASFIADPDNQPFALRLGLPF
jgi:membrane protease YdiL (CAAX protease family)